MYSAEPQFLESLKINSSISLTIEEIFYAFLDSNVWVYVIDFWLSSLGDSTCHVFSFSSLFWNSRHNRFRQALYSPQLLTKSGCAEQHYLVQECMVEHRDWRRCQQVLKVGSISASRVCIIVPNSLFPPKWYLFSARNILIFTFHHKLLPLTPPSSTYLSLLPSIFFYLWLLFSSNFRYYSKTITPKKKLYDSPSYDAQVRYLLLTHLHYP